LRERYRASAPSTYAHFEALAARLAGTPESPDALASLRRELHRVRGTAGSYGFAEASRLAAALEQRALRWAVEPALDHGRRSTAVLAFVDALRAALDAPGG
jgi:chemotaxis protein histidine kinase CheA